MSMREKSQGDVGRRDFLKLFEAAGAAAGTLPLAGSASADETKAAAVATHDHATAAGSRTGGAGYEFFNVNESAFIEAAIDTLIEERDTGGRPTKPIFQMRIGGSNDEIDRIRLGCGDRSRNRSSPCARHTVRRECGSRRHGLQEMHGLS